MQQDQHVGTAHSGTVACVECGNLFPQSEVIQFGQYSVCVNCKPAFQQKLAEGSFQPTKLSYAGGWRRFVAVSLDGIITAVVFEVAGLLLLPAIGMSTSAIRNGTGFGWVLALWYVCAFLMGIAYIVYFIGRFGATPGKMALGVKVVRADGSAVGYWLALGRYFANLVSGFTMGIGYLMAFFDKEKRALHDRICGTRVILTR